MDKEQAATELNKAFVDNLLHIYAAVKTIRDAGTEELNRGISNPRTRGQTKESWAALNEFCKAYENFVDVLRKEKGCKS